ncbi:hypothetical protein CASFOL_027904 [Castilleja foliolosa]|uniref:Eukaryotic translation initiation factor 3 30 kDa subunit n=1 Tax=Castilleja foliolosa TaxID=1961234 RepID=A0ABD3CG50_9LAMI
MVGKIRKIERLFQDDEETKTILDEPAPDVAEDEPVPNLLKEDNNVFLPLCMIKDLFFGPNDVKYDIDTTAWEPEPWERRYVKKEQDISSDVESSEAEKKKKKGFEALKEAPLDPSGEKLCQQRLFGEDDYKSTAKLFGKMGDEKTLDSFIPKSESDFTEYAELVAHKLRPYEKSYHYIGLLKDVMRLSMVSLKGSDAKDVILSITAIANEKIKVEKEANARKKKTGARIIEDEIVPSLLKKDYKLKSNNTFTKEDDEDLDNKLKSNWDDEDLDDNDVKDSWEEEDEPAPAPKTEPMPIEKPPKKTVAKTVEKKGNSSEAVKDANAWKKKTEDEPVVNLRKEDNNKLLPLCLIKDLFFRPNDEKYDIDTTFWEPEPWERRYVKKEQDISSDEDSCYDEFIVESSEAEKKKKKGFEALKEAPLDPSGEKLCQQRLVGEDDYKSTAELFGKMGDEKTLDSFIPKSESDFTEYAELVAHKLRPYEKSYHYIGLLKDVMRLSMVSLKGSDAKDVILSITAIANEKIKVEKEANAGKKKTEDEPDEPVPSLLKKDNKRKSTYDDGDLDDNENKTKRFEEALKEVPLDPVEDLDDRFIRPYTVGNTNSNQNDEQGEEEQDCSSDENFGENVERAASNKCRHEFAV